MFNMEPNSIKPIASFCPVMQHGVDDVNHCPVGNPKRKV
jgi:hypothetical protein